MRIRHITTRFALMLATAALVPLMAFGVWSLATLQGSIRASVVASALTVVDREAEDISRDLAADADVLNALATDLQDSGLGGWQQDRLLRNYAARFPQLREIAVFDEAGAAVATNRTGGSNLSVPPDPGLRIDGIGLSPVQIDKLGVPVTRTSTRLTRDGRASGWLVADIGLADVRALVHEIRIGTRGFALLIDADGRLLANGAPERRPLALGARLSPNPSRGAAGASATWHEYQDEHGESQVGASARVPGTNWSLIVEQPAADAFASATHLERQLAFAALTALILVLVAGVLAGRRFIVPIVQMERATQALAAGDFRARVSVSGVDELSRLARSFNGMADRLVQLQQDIKNQERQVMFGRVVAGLFHDLNHPIQNIGNNARLLLRDDIDRDTRELVRQTLERELIELRHFMDDVRHAAQPRPLDRFPIDVNASLSEAIEAVRAEGVRNLVAVSGRFAPGLPPIDGDRFALGRVYRNLLTNALQATPSGGSVTVSTRRAGDAVEVEIADTGVGIAADRLNVIFDDFVTTKGLGLGLGLATSRRIVEQLGGAITVDSEPGRGTTFTLRFPASAPRAIEAAS